MRWMALAQSGDVAAEAAARLVAAVRENPRLVARASHRQHTGRDVSPRVARLPRGGRCFSRAATFNLDEYVGLPRRARRVQEMGSRMRRRH